MVDLGKSRVAKIILANDVTEPLHSHETEPPHEGNVITKQPPASSNADGGVRYHFESKTCIKDEDVVSDIKPTTMLSIDQQKKLKRIASNRLSAKNSRIKKAKYYADMENTVKVLEAKVSMLHPQIEHEKQELLRLQVENSNMLQRLSTLEEMESLKDAQIENTRAEIKKLKEEPMMTGSYHELEQKEEQLDLGYYDHSGLDEITTESFYLENGPQSLAETNFNLVGVVELMPSFSPSIANQLNLDGLDGVQDLSPTTIARPNNSPSN